MFGILRALTLLVGVSAATLAHAQAAAGDFAVAPGESSLTYHLVHKLHKINGTSHKVDGKAHLSPDGKAQVMVRVPAESFDSGNVNRDAHMKEAVEAVRFPSIELKAIGDGVTTPSSFPTTQKKTWKVQLDFHGIKQTFDLPVDLTWESANRVRAATTLTISLDGYKVERPSLMFVKVDDPLKIDAKLTFTR